MRFLQTALELANATGGVAAVDLLDCILGRVSYSAEACRIAGQVEVVAGARMLRDHAIDRAGVEPGL